jgi:transposase
MDHSGAAVAAGRRIRRWRSISEKLQIVQLTTESGACVAEVAREHGVNANHVFKWRRAFDRGELIEAGAALAAWLPVILSEKPFAEPASQGSAPLSGDPH